MDSSGVLICDLISVSDTPTTLSSLTSKTVVFSLSQSSASLGIQAGNDATIFHHNITLYFWVYPAPPCSQPHNSVILSSLCCQNIFKLKTWWYPCWHLTVGIVQGSMIEQISSKIPVQTARPGSRNVWIMWGDVTVLLLCIHTIWRNPCPCHKKCTPNTGDSSAVTKTDINAAGSCSVVTSHHHLSHDVNKNRFPIIIWQIQVTATSVQVSSLVQFRLCDFWSSLYPADSNREPRQLRLNLKFRTFTGTLDLSRASTYPISYSSVTQCHEACKQAIIRWITHMSRGLFLVAGPGLWFPKRQSISAGVWQPWRLPPFGSEWSSPASQI